MADLTVDALLVRALSEAGLPSIVRELVRVVPGPAGAVNDHSLITLVDAERNRLACELAFMLYKAAARAAVAARGGHSTNAPWVAQAVEQYVRSLPTGSRPSPLRSHKVLRLCLLYGATGREVHAE